MSSDIERKEFTITGILSEFVLNALYDMRHKSFSPSSGKLWFSLEGVVERANFPRNIFSFSENDDRCIESEKDKEYRYECERRGIIPYHAWKIKVPGEEIELISTAPKKISCPYHMLIKGQRPRNLIFDIEEYGRFTGEYNLEVLRREGYLPIRGILKFKTGDSGRKEIVFPPDELIFDVESQMKLRLGMPHPEGDERNYYRERLVEWFERLRAD